MLHFAPTFHIVKNSTFIFEQCKANNWRKLKFGHISLIGNCSIDEQTKDEQIWLLQIVFNPHFTQKLGEFQFTQTIIIFLVLFREPQASTASRAHVPLFVALTETRNALFGIEPSPLFCFFPRYWLPEHSHNGLTMLCCFTFDLVVGKIIPER